MNRVFHFLPEISWLWSTQLCPTGCVISASYASLCLYLPICMGFILELSLVELNEVGTHPSRYSAWHYGSHTQFTVLFITAFGIRVWVPLYHRPPVSMTLHKGKR